MQRKTDRQTDGQMGKKIKTERQTYGQADIQRKADRQTDGQIGRQICRERQTNRRTKGKADMQRKTDRQTEGQMGRQIEGHSNRWTDGQTNIPAYHENSQITTVKSFITLGPGANVIKLFLSVIYRLFCPWKVLPAWSNVCG